MWEDWVPRLQSLSGIFVFTLLAWAVSERRAAVSVRYVVRTLAALIAMTAVLVHVPTIQRFLGSLTRVAEVLQEATLAGTRFVFGYVGGGELPFDVVNEGATFSFAFQALPLIILMSGLANLLWHWGILKWIIKGIGKGIQRAFIVRGPVGLATGANLLFGPAESALLVKPYLQAATRGEMFAIMTVGTSTVSGTVMVLYASVLGSVHEAVFGHVIVASLLSLPAGLLVAQLMVPNEPAPDNGTENPNASPHFHGGADAFVRGLADGGALYLGILAAVFGFIAAVALVDIFLATIPDVLGAPLSLSRIVGWAFAPFAWLAGASWSESAVAGSLLGTKVVLNELIAYVNLAKLDPGTLSPRTGLIMIYALCGFANTGSVGLLASGFGALVPKRRAEIITLAPRAIASGTLASLLTAACLGLVM